jgi:hypothetical protein
MPEEKISVSTRLQKSLGLLTQTIDDDIVIMHPERGEYFGLHLPGTRIWELLNEPTTCAAIVDTLMGEFEGDRKTIEQDVLHLLREMAKKDLIHVVDS